MNLCPTCGNFYPDDIKRCPLDGNALERHKDPLVGTVLGGKYRLFGKIGEGGMGLVYYGVNLGIERAYAIKILPTAVDQDETMKQRFLREAKASNIVGHENIVQVYDVGVSDGMLFIVMELIEGESLERMIERQGRLDTKSTVYILKQVCEALGVAHTMGVIHRDIKPGNIILTRRSDKPLFVKILDFGLAQIMTDPRLTDKGKAVGTPHYMSPEQARGGKGSPSMDLYSLGCMAYEMLSGKPPFEGESPAEIVLKHFQSPPVPLLLETKDVPPELDRIVMRLLRKNPEERHRDAYELLAELDDLQPDEIDILEVISPERDDRTLTGKDLAASSRKRVSGSWKKFIDKASKTLSLQPELAQTIPHLESLDREREELAAKTEEILKKIEALQNEGRQRQARMGNALSELARDLSSKKAQYMACLARLSDIKSRLTELESKMKDVAGNSKTIASFINNGHLTPDVAEAFMECGNLCSTWKIMSAELDEGKASARINDEEMIDIEFQIAKLKEQLETGNNEMESKLAELNGQLEKVNARKVLVEKELSAIAMRMNQAGA
jgi:serine/threonine protein kinase